MSIERFSKLQPKTTRNKQKIVRTKREKQKWSGRLSVGISRTAREVILFFEPLDQGDLRREERKKNYIQG